MPPSSKFAGVDFSELPIEHLTSELTISGQGFRCLRGEFVTYWRQGRIQRDIDARISQCWILRCEDSLAGYITLLTDKLELDEPVLLDEGVQYQSFPAIKIGLLAVDRRAKGAGRRLVEWAVEYVAAEISPTVGVRFMTLTHFTTRILLLPMTHLAFTKSLVFNLSILMSLYHHQCLIVQCISISSH